MHRQDLFKDEKEHEFVLARETLELMSAPKLTIGQVAIEVELVTDEVNAFISMLAPGEAQVIGRVEHAAQKALPYVQGAASDVGIIRSWVDNGAKKASEDGGKEAAWMLADELSPLVAMSHGILTHAENETGMAKYKAEVQHQVEMLVRTAAKWHDKEVEERSKAQSIDEIRQQITSLCTNTPLFNIGPK